MSNLSDYFNFEAAITEKRFFAYMAMIAVLTAVLFRFDPDMPETMAVISWLWNFLCNTFSFVFSIVFLRGFLKGLISFVSVGIVALLFVLALSAASYYTFRALFWFVVSPAFCIFYTVKYLPQSIPIMLILFTVSMLARHKKIGRTIWLISALLPYAAGLIYSDDALLKILILPMFYLISVAPGDVTLNRFTDKNVQIGAALSSTQKRQMAGLSNSNWWDFVRPHVEYLPNVLFHKNELGTDEKEAAQKLLASRVDGLKMNSGTLSSKIQELQRRDSGFNPQQFINKARTSFQKIQKACYEQKLERICHLVSDSLYEQFLARIEDQKSKGIIYKCANLKIESADISHIYSDSGFDEIVVLVNASSQDELFDTVTNKKLSGGSEIKKYSEYWSFVRRTDTKTSRRSGLIDSQCPNCGAPLAAGQSTVCSACGSFIRSGSYDWVLTKIVQTYEMTHSSPEIISGWKELKADDADFTMHNLDDVAGVLFWRLRSVERLNDTAPADRFITPKFQENFKAILADYKGKMKNCWENVALGCIYLQGIKQTETTFDMFLQVVWSGIPYITDEKGLTTPGTRINRTVRDVFVMTRPKGIKTNLNNTLSSAQCPNCGAPLKNFYVSCCDYCKYDLNDPNAWKLARVLHGGDDSYRELVEEHVAAISNTVFKSYIKKADEKKAEYTSERLRSGRDVVAIMAEMLYADGVIDDSEMKMLKEAADKYHIPDDVLNGILESVKRGEDQGVMPRNRTEALDVLQSAANMMFADGIVTDEEDAAFAKLASKLGLDKFSVKMVTNKAHTLMKKTRADAEKNQPSE